MRTGGKALTSRASARADRAVPSPDKTYYERFYPYYAELCALSELRKKRGFGVRVRSGMGGHSLLYLSGVCLDNRSGYPTLRLCDPDTSPHLHGVGISVNAHYKNANWVATEGRNFVWYGALRPGERLTHEAYERTQDRAKAMGLLDHIEFHDHLFRNKPRGMSERDYMYEISIATDYAICFGRNAYRARVPLDRRRMSAIVEFLNGLNTPYRDDSQVFRWNVFNNNCSHVVHNALAVGSIWAPWPTGKNSVLAMFKFPVPKNEFVDLMSRMNDLPIHDAQAIYENREVRKALFEANVLPTVHGALAIATPAIRDNEIYETARLRLIFYDNPFWGSYRRRFSDIFSEPRYFDLRSNLRHFAAIYDMALQRRDAEHAFTAIRGGGSRIESDEKAGFYTLYGRYIERELEKVRLQLAFLDYSPQNRKEFVS
jgi:hypothetical protein